MNLVINRKKYDTETANLLASTENGRDTSQQSYKYQALYQKKTGEYFLFTQGMHSPYWDGKWDITPYTEDEAKDWAEGWLSVKRYEEIFGEVKE